MIVFKNWLVGPTEGAEDSRVLLVGVVCSVLIFSIFTIICDDTPAATVSKIAANNVDLVQDR